MVYREPSDTGFECEFCLHENDHLFPCNKCLNRGGKKLLFTEKIPMPPVKPPKEEINHPDRYASGKFECIDVMLDVQMPFNQMEIIYQKGGETMFHLDFEINYCPMCGRKLKSDN